MTHKYIFIYIAILYCGVVSASAQEPESASDSDALVNIDQFLSDGIENEGSGTAALATESADTPTFAGTPGKIATETEQEGDVAGSDGWKPLPLLPPLRQASGDDVGKTVRPTGEGTLDVVVTTVREKTPRQISIMPDRVELWAQDRLLATLENGEPGVENAFHRRTFSFPPLTLPAGYYYLTIRGFAEGFVTRERKWKGKNVQIGIHDGKTTKLREALSMFVW